MNGQMTLFDYTREQVKESICDNYCKYPDMYLSEYSDPDEAHEIMVNECCAKCPLERLKEEN